MFAALGSQYFGNFDQTDLNAFFTLSKQSPASEPFNRPDDCEALTEDVTVSGQTFPRPIGIEQCSVNSDNTGWSIFPWVVDLAKAGKGFPACADAAQNNYATFLASTSPAFDPSEDGGYEGNTKPEDVSQYVCQNFQPVDLPKELLDALAAAPASSSG